MKYLLDTSVFIYFLRKEESKIPRKIVEVFSNERSQFVVSVASLWEISIKYTLGKLSLAERPGYWIMETIQRIGWQTLLIGPEHALCVCKLPPYHKDPFDRLLIAQAKIEGLPLISSDTKLKKYKIDIMW